VGVPAEFSSLLSAAVLMSNNLVLIVGGAAAPPADPNQASSQGWLWNPIDESFTAIPAPMRTARIAPLAATLPDGRVLVSGGGTGGGLAPLNASAAVETFDPDTGTFENTLLRPSAGGIRGTATTLDDGTVLLLGGGNPPPATPLPGVNPAAQIYAPGTPALRP
jgi:hypothetical protein